MIYTCVDRTVSPATAAAGCHMQDSQSVNCDCNYLIITILGKLSYIIRLPLSARSSYYSLSRSKMSGLLFIFIVDTSSQLFNTAALDPRPEGARRILPHFTSLPLLLISINIRRWSEHFIDSPGIYCLEIFTRKFARFSAY